MGIFISQFIGTYLVWVDVIPKFIGFIKSLPNSIKLDTLFIDFINADELCARYNLA